MASPHRGNYTFTWSVRHAVPGQQFSATQAVTAQQYGVSDEIPGFVSFWQWLPGDVKQYVASFPVDAVVSIAPAAPVDEEDQYHAETWKASTSTSTADVPF